MSYYTSTTFHDATIVGNMNIAFEANSYLNIGPFWRINASSDGKLLIFQYNPEPTNVNSTWNSATPYIQYHNNSM